MQKNFETKKMYKVFYVIDGKMADAMFETKTAAVIFKEAMNAKGLMAEINNWLWLTKIEK